MRSGFVGYSCHARRVASIFPRYDGKRDRGKRKEEKGKRKEERGKRKAKSGKRKAERGKRKEERGKRKLRKVFSVTKHGFVF